MKRVFLVFFLLPFFCLAQQKIKQEIIEKRVMMLLDQSSGEIEFDEQLYDRLEYYFDHRIDLNTSSKETLKELAILNDHQVMNLLIHIEKYGKLISIHELQAIKGFDLETITLLEPFVTVKSKNKYGPKDLREKIAQGEHDIFLRQIGFLQKSRNSSYNGSSHRYYLRYRFNASNAVRWGITAEKDPGEGFFTEQQKKGFDFYSAHLMVKEIGKVEKLLIGDYDLKFGQGLTIWSGYSFNNSESIIDQKRNNIGLLPHISSEENNFLRGVASTIGLGKLKFSAFVSDKKIDANVNTGLITSFPSSGLHRTASELSNKKAVKERIVGLRTEFNTKSLELGITILNVNYNRLVAESDELYKFHSFSGNQFQKTGLDYNWLYRNTNFYGEFSLSQGGISYLNGCHALLTPQLSFSSTVRSFSNSFIAEKTNTASNWLSPAGEQGIYVGLEYKLIKKITISAYLDQFRNRWLKYNLSGLGKGQLQYFGVRYRLNRNTKIDLSFIKRIKPQNVRITTIPSIHEIESQKLRLNLKYVVSPSWSFANRLECHFFNKTERGFMMYQDLNYKSKSGKVSFSVRYAIFDTPSFNSAIYAYEKDVLYAYQFPPYFNSGSRIYGLGRFKLTPKMTIWVKYSNWFYLGQEVYKAGVEWRNGNQKSELKIQARIRI